MVPAIQYDVSLGVQLRCVKQARSDLAKWPDGSTDDKWMLQHHSMQQHYNGGVARSIITWPLLSTKDALVSSRPCAVEHISQSKDTMSKTTLSPAQTAHIVAQVTMYLYPLLNSNAV